MIVIKSISSKTAKELEYTLRHWIDECEFAYSLQNQICDIYIPVEVPAIFKYAVDTMFISCGDDTVMVDRMDYQYIKFE